MQIYKSYTRASARESKGYDARMAEKLFQANPKFHTVHFAQRGRGIFPGCGARLKPIAQGELVYIKATSGKWAMHAELRSGPELPYELNDLRLHVALATA